MRECLVTSVCASEHRIATARGSLHAKTWVPSNASPGAPALLVFHDSLGCVDLWRAFPEQLAAATERTVVAYDRLGFGRSDPHPGPLALTFIRDEAASVVPLVCDSLGLAAIIPVGHSVGGGIAIATSACWPQRCAGVVTMAAQSFVEHRTLAGIRAAQAEFERPGQAERLMKYHGDKARWVLNSWIETWLSPAFAGWNLDGDLAGVHCPILAIHGDRDEYGSLRHVQRIESLAAGVCQPLILTCGHFPHREHPERVIEEIARFVGSIGSG